MTKINYDTVQDLYNEGCTDAAIARKVDCEPASIYQWRRKNDLKPNGKGGNVKKETPVKTNDPVIEEKHCVKCGASYPSNKTHVCKTHHDEDEAPAKKAELAFSIPASPYAGCGGGGLGGGGVAEAKRLIESEQAEKQEFADRLKQFEMKESEKRPDDHVLELDMARVIEKVNLRNTISELQLENARLRGWQEGVAWLMSAQNGYASPTLTSEGDRQHDS